METLTRLTDGRRYRSVCRAVVLVAIAALAAATTMSSADAGELQALPLGLQQGSPVGASIVQSGTQSGLTQGRSGLRLQSGSCDNGRFVIETVAAPFPFNAVGLHWGAEIPADAAVNVRLSTSANGQTWSELRSVPIQKDLTEGKPGMGGVAVNQTISGLTFRKTNDGRQARLHIELSASSNCESPTVRDLTLVFLDSTAGPSEGEILSKRAKQAARGDSSRVQAPLDAQNQAPEQHAHGTPVEPQAFAKPDVVSRGEWGADSPQCGLSYCQPTTHAGIHHTASSGDYQDDGFSDCAATVRAHQDYHMYTRGWCDIGYNYLVCKHGLIWEGRHGGDNVRGAHDGYNCDSMGVSMMGYYHSPHNNSPTSASLEALEDLIAWKADQNGIDPHGSDYYRGYGSSMSTIYGHRNVKSTSCPGDLMYNKLGEVRNGVASRIDGDATGDLVGIVFNADTEARITGATATLNTGQSTTTNSNGYYEFNGLTAGSTYDITVSASGYHSKTQSETIEAGIDNWESFWLEPSATRTVTTR